ncbi:MAG: hypothetical protein CMH65_10635 [Nevskiales bacterium]|nr:hypothetical protein [Nevskiales bacterium]
MDAEVCLLRPRVPVALGQTAAAAVQQRQPQDERHYGQTTASRYATPCVATWHPAAIPRSRTPAEQALRTAQLTQVLISVRQLSDAPPA